MRTSRKKLEPNNSAESEPRKLVPRISVTPDEYKPRRRSGPPRIRVTGYKHPFDWYSREYNLTLSTINLLRRHGAPLDDPVKVFDMIVNKLRSRPADLSVLAQKVKEATGEMPATPPHLADRLIPLEERRKRQFEMQQTAVASAEEIRDDGKRGVTAELRRLEEETAKAYRIYAASKDHVEKLANYKVWTALLSEMRKLAKDAPASEREAGRHVPIEEVEAVWTRGLLVFSKSLDTLPRRVATHPLFKKLDPHDVEEFIQSEVSALKTKLYNLNWKEEISDASSG